MPSRLTSPRAALEVAAAPVPPVPGESKAAAAPHVQPGMDRAGVPPVDPVRVLSSLSTEELGKIPALDMLQLSAFFASLGLPELPATVVRNGLNGSILHTLSAAGKFAPRSCGPAPRQCANSRWCAPASLTSQSHLLEKRRRTDGPPFARRGQGVPDALRPARQGGPLRDAPGGAGGATTDVLGQDPRMARRAVQLPQHVRGQGRAQPSGKDVRLVQLQPHGQRQASRVVHHFVQRSPFHRRAALGGRQGAQGVQRLQSRLRGRQRGGVEGEYVLRARARNIHLSPLRYQVR